MINFNLLTSKIQYRAGLVGGMPDTCCPALLGVVLQLDTGQADLREFLQLPLIAIVCPSFTSPTCIPPVLRGMTAVVTPTPLHNLV